MGWIIAGILLLLLVVVLWRAEKEIQFYEALCDNRMATTKMLLDGIRSERCNHQKEVVRLNVEKWNLQRQNSWLEKDRSEIASEAERGEYDRMRHLLRVITGKRPIQNGSIDWRKPLDTATPTSDDTGAR